MSQVKPKKKAKAEAVETEEAAFEAAFDFLLL